MTPATCVELANNLINLRRGECKRLTIFVCAGTMWALWKTRNDLVFNDKIAASPLVPTHKLVSHLTQWKVMLKPKEKTAMEEMISKLARACEAALDPLECCAPCNFC